MQSYLSVIPSALIAVDRELRVEFINPAAEMLLGVSASQSLGQPFTSLPAITPELLELCERVLATGEAVTLFEQELSALNLYTIVTLHITPTDMGHVLISIERNDERHRLAASEWKRETARTTGVMASMLAHEVKNPLSGIRGAAQLLREEIAPEHQPLADLICLETDRIRDLIDQVEIFSAGAPAELQPLNIHESLQYAIQVAQSGFARHVAFKEKYDPSLPEVMGRRDLLVQLFLNLIKNAAEALENTNEPVVTISTAYRTGYRMHNSRSEGKMELPVAVIIEDNGPGIPESIRGHLFEPFVSSKEEGRGLGLAIVAKTAADLSAVVELDEEYNGGARFVVWLPVAKA